MSQQTLSIGRIVRFVETKGGTIRPAIVTKVYGPAYDSAVELVVFQGADRADPSRIATAVPYDAEGNSYTYHWPGDTHTQPVALLPAATTTEQEAVTADVEIGTPDPGPAPEQPTEPVTV